MIIEHGKSKYQITLILYVFDCSDRITSINYFTIEDFKYSMGLNYPDIKIDSFLDFVNSNLDNIRNWIDTGKPYNTKWERFYFYAGVVGKELLYSNSGTLLSCRMNEKYKRLNEVTDDFICKIESYGWTVSHMREVGLEKITYYTSPNAAEGSHQKYMIYAYKDYVILGNANIDNPSIISGKYFLYNGGKKPEP